MAGNRKLNRPTDQRVAVIRGLATDLLWYGRIQTTEARAKEVRKQAEKIITMGIKTYNDVLTVTKTTVNDKGQKVEKEYKNDGPSKLTARRRMMSYLYEREIARKEGEKKAEYKVRVADIKHPVISKIFDELAPKYAKRAEEKGQGGGYTRIIKMGPRRGDAAETVILELVD